MIKLLVIALNNNLRENFLENKIYFLTGINSLILGLMHSDLILVHYSCVNPFPLFLFFLL